MSKINQKIERATFWASLTQIIAKFISPLTNMILARILAPEIFGVVATVTMVSSFTIMIAEAGFQKFLIQRPFISIDERNIFATVAFWSNLFLSFFLWIIIIIFNQKIAALIGSPGLGIVIIIACAALPLTAFTSIQIALYNKEFDFKALFLIRLVGVLLPFIVTIPLAYIYRSYWALIIGNLAGHICNVIILALKSKWRPSIYYDFKILKKMISFSVWTILERVTEWLNHYIGVFFIGYFLTEYFVGIYQISMITANSIIAIVTAAIIPVLYTSLSALQADEKKFQSTLYSFQRYTSYLIIPMGVGIFLYRDLVTTVLLGDSWESAQNFIGLWALVSTVRLIFTNYLYEAYRALAMPKLNVFVQALQIIILIPIFIIGVQYEFRVLYIMRSASVLPIIVINVVISKYVINLSPAKMTSSILPAVISALIMCFPAVYFQMINTHFIWNMISIFLCIIIYFLSLITLFPSCRSELKKIKEKFQLNFKRPKKV